MKQTKAAYTYKSTGKKAVGLMFICVRRFPEDGILVPKHVGVDVYRAFCCIIYSSLYCIKCTVWQERKFRKSFTRF